MTFKVTARTLLHLGAELISSDGIAFYELIKNGLDARSKTVDLSVVVRLPFEAYEYALQRLGYIEDDDNEPLEEGDEEGLSDLMGYLVTEIVADAPAANDLEAELREAQTAEELLEVVLEANYIDIKDVGEGMSLQDLDDNFLTIGTDNRVRLRRSETKAQQKSRRYPIVGEKGLGRLSAMRLGDRMRVATTKAGDTNWHILKIDWMDFAKAAGGPLADVPVAPHEGRTKTRSSFKGTRIHLSALKEDWTVERLIEIVQRDFGRLVDPFSPDMRLPLTVRFNDIEVPIPEFAKFIFSHAHATLIATYNPDAPDGPVLDGEVNYRLRRRAQKFHLRTVDLASVTRGASAATLKRIGPFTMEVYWFNRRILTKIDGIGDLATVRGLIKQWGGGVMLFRDGFRVHPYGGPDDDWLSLDRDAFSTSGFKVNRGQIVAKADITGRGNKYLVDQTNREGLRDGPEKQAFIKILASVMEQQFREFLNFVDDDLARAERLTLADLNRRIDAEDSRLRQLILNLKRILPKGAESDEVLASLQASVSQIAELHEQVRANADAGERDRNRLVHLASVGLMIEILAHELWRATNGAIKTVGDARQRSDDRLAPTLRVLDAQLRTLQKRLKILDPLSTNARQVKEQFDIVEWVRTIVEEFAKQAGRREIKLTVRVVPQGGKLVVSAVRGMIVQVIENLLINSVYWIGQKRKLMGDFDARIDVEIDCDEGVIRVSDNGPGVPADRRERIFDPFFSTKPSGDGRGLGLYISREIAGYHGGRLAMEEPSSEDDTLNTFEFDLGAMHG